MKTFSPNSIEKIRQANFVEAIKNTIEDYCYLNNLHPPTYILDHFLVAAMQVAVDLDEKSPKQLELNFEKKDK